MQLSGAFFGSVAAFQPRNSKARSQIPRGVRAEKAASAGTWLPGVESPRWLEEADLPANRGAPHYFWKRDLVSEAELGDQARSTRLTSFLSAGFDILNFGTDKSRLEW